MKGHASEDTRQMKGHASEDARQMKGTRLKTSASFVINS